MEHVIHEHGAEAGRPEIFGGYHETPIIPDILAAQEKLKQISSWNRLLKMEKLIKHNLICVTGERRHFLPERAHV